MFSCDATDAVIHVSRESRGSDTRKSNRYESRPGYVNDRDGMSV